MTKIAVVDMTDFDKKQMELIKTSVEEALSSHLPKPQEEILSMKQVCSLLQKSRQTIISWSDKHILKRHYIADSLFYLRSEVLAAMQDTPSSSVK